MTTQSKTPGKIKTQITRFSNRLSSGLNKPKRKFLHQMIYGIQASKDIKLTNIGRSLGEEVPLKKTENKQILGAIDLVREAIGKKEIWTLDRGADRGIIFKGLLTSLPHFQEDKISRSVLALY